MSDQRGTDRDYDETETSRNQGHGHAREKRGREGHAGESDRVAREKVRGNEGVGGKVRRKDNDGD